MIATSIGLSGAALALAAYFLLSAGKIGAHHYTYPLLNMVGSLGILFSLYWQWNLASAVINSIWVVISVVGMVRIYFRKTGNDPA